MEANNINLWHYWVRVWYLFTHKLYFINVFLSLSCVWYYYEHYQYPWARKLRKLKYKLMHMFELNEILKTHFVSNIVRTVFAPEFSSCTLMVWFYLQGDWYIWVHSSSFSLIRSDKSRNVILGVTQFMSHNKMGNSTINISIFTYYYNSLNLQ